MGASGVADIGDQVTTELRRSRHALPGPDELAHAIGSGAHDRRKIVREYAWQRRHARRVGQHAARVMAMISAWLLFIE
jgi:hypothetical protein